MDIETNTGLETKAGIPPDAVVTHAEMMRAFEEFKDTNDKRLAGIDRRRIDVLLNEKVARIDQTIDAQARRIDEIALKNSRPIISGERLRGSPEHKMAFATYVRLGEDTNLRSLEWKALSAGSNPDGPFLVPPKLKHRLVRG